jgi:hypothetical protein
MGEVLCELLDSSANEVDILITLFKKDLGNLGSFALVAHVNDDQLIRLVFEAEQLWDNLVTTNIRSWVVDGLFNVEHLVFLGVSHVQQQKLCVLCNTQHLGSIGHCRNLRHSL